MEEVTEPFALLTPVGMEVKVFNGKVHLSQPWLGIYREAGFVTQRELDRYNATNEYDVDAVFSGKSRRSDAIPENLKPSLQDGAFVLVRKAEEGEAPETDFQVQTFRDGGITLLADSEPGMRTLAIDSRSDLPSYWEIDVPDLRPGGGASRHLSLAFYVRAEQQQANTHGWVTCPVDTHDQVFIVFLDDVEEGFVQHTTKAELLAEDGLLTLWRRVLATELFDSAMWDEATAAVGRFDPASGLLVVLLTPCLSVKCRVVFLPFTRSP